MVLQRGVRLSGRSGPDDSAVVDEQCGIGDDLELAEAVEVVDDQFADPGEELHDGRPFPIESGSVPVWTARRRGSTAFRR